MPFRYALEAPVALYMMWMTVSVFWQNYLTLGLLQSCLGERLPGWGVLTASAVIFWLGHAVFLPQSHWNHVGHPNPGGANRRMAIRQVKDPVSRHFPDAQVMLLTEIRDALTSQPPNGTAQSPGGPKN